MVDPMNDRWRDHVRIGDVFLEAFHDCKYISWERETSNAYNTREPWMVRALPKWGHAEGGGGKPTGISDTKIPNIINLYQSNGRSVIKTWKMDKRKLFEQYLDKPFVRGLNRLQQTPWRVNKTIHKALKDNAGEFLHDIAEITDEKQQRKLAAKNREYHAIMEVANSVRLNREFYYYVECDWRGRIYYTQNNFNYQGNDVARGQLEFAHGKELTEDGRFWLAVHTANSFNQEYNIDEIPEWCEEDYKSYLEGEELDAISVDKMTLQDRANWTYNHLKSIVEIGEALQFMSKAEKPVVFLACCIEWYNWKTHVEATGEDNYISHLPIPVDGSSNGRQHLPACASRAIAARCCQPLDEPSTGIGR